MRNSSTVNYLILYHVFVIFIIKIQEATTYWERMSLYQKKKMGNFYIIYYLFPITWTYELLYKLFYTYLGRKVFK